MCYVHNQWYDISCTILYIACLVYLLRWTIHALLPVWYIMMNISKLAEENTEY